MGLVVELFDDGGDSSDDPSVAFGQEVPSLSVIKERVLAPGQQ